MCHPEASDSGSERNGANISDTRVVVVISIPLHQLTPGSYIRIPYILSY